MSIENTNGSLDAKRLWTIASNVASRTRSKWGQEFGKPMTNLGENGLSDIANMIVNELFNNELKAISESYAGTGLDSIRGSLRKDLVDKMRNMYVAAAENSMFKYSQQAGHYLTTLGTIDQLHLVSLIAGVVQSCYPVVFKTFVEKGLVFSRMVDLPYAITPDGKAIDFFELVNNGDKLEKICGVNSPTTTIKLAFTDRAIKDNLINRFNKALLANNAKSTELAGPYNFLNAGVEISKLVYTHKGEDKEVNVKYTTTGFPTQSGQISDTCGTFDARFDSKDGTGEPIRITGSVKLDGTIELNTNATDLKEVGITFNIPAVGPQRPLSFGSRKSPIIVRIKDSYSSTTTLNEQFKQHNTIILKQDLIEDFHKFSTTALTRYKDTKAFKFINNTIENLENVNDELFVNNETYHSVRRTYAKQKVQVYNADMGYIDSFKAHTNALAMAAFKVTNKLEIALNPQERRYMVYSSSTASQWLEDADGESFHKFREIGDLGEGQLAGMSLPYTLRKIKIGGHSTGYFISTNIDSIKSKVEIKTVGTHENVPVDVHRYIFIPQYEETLDTFAFIQGPEFIEQGTGTEAFSRNTSLQLETMFDMAAFNESLGVIDLEEKPITFEA